MAYNLRIMPSQRHDDSGLYANNFLQAAWFLRSMAAFYGQDPDSTWTPFPCLHKYRQHSHIGSCKRYEYLLADAQTSTAEIVGAAACAQAASFLDDLRLEGRFQWSALEARGQRKSVCESHSTTYLTL